MEDELLKVFTPFSTYHRKLQQFDFKTSNQFYLKINTLEHSLPVWISYTDHYIFVITENKENIKESSIFVTQMDFELRFEVLRQQWPDELTPGIPIGIKFDRSFIDKGVEFYAIPQTIQKWRKILEKKINQRNFHKLFKAKKKIGKGAFATVYLAQGLVDKEMVAVKAFSKEKQFSAKNGKEALINEIQILRELNHPNVTKLYGIYETQNSLYMILQSLQGGQLNERIKNQKTTGNQCRSIIRNLLSALSHLARKKIIHRDIKPENIIFKKNNSTDLVLCDYGLATRADQQRYLFVRCGTPGFVAPQIINIKDMNSKSDSISDVFSAGIIFHYLLFGTSIFPGKKYNQVLNQNRQCLFDFSQSKYNSLDSSAKDLLIRMLEVKPQLRITAEQALNHEYFQDFMDIQSGLQQTWRIPLSCINNIPRKYSQIYQVPKLSARGDHNGKKINSWKQNYAKLNLTTRCQTKFSN